MNERNARLPIEATYVSEISSHDEIKDLPQTERLATALLYLCINDRRELG